MRRGLLLLLHLEPGEHEFHQFAHALAMGGGDRQRLADPEFVEIGGGSITGHALRLVDREPETPAAAAQPLRHHAILGRQPVAAIHQHDDGVGFVDRLQGLARHLVHDAGLRHRLQAAGVDHDVGLATDPPLTVVAVTRQPRHVVHDRVAGLGETVEQGRLPDVRAADQDHGGLHGRGWILMRCRRIDGSQYGWARPQRL